MARNTDFLSGNRLLDAGLTAAAGTDAINGSIIDARDATTVTFYIKFGTIADTAVTSFKAQDAPVTAGTNGVDTVWTDIAGSEVTVAADDDNESFFLEIIKPRNRYVRVAISRGTANATVLADFVILSGNRTEPDAHASAFNITTVRVET